MPPAEDPVGSDTESRDLPGATEARGDSIRERRTLRFVLLSFVAVGLVVAAAFYVDSLLPSRPLPTDKLVFSDVSLVDGNASFLVQGESGGPYSYGGFETTLVVNDFPGPSIGLGPPQSIARFSIGPNFYRITWLDPDADGAPGVGDSFLVSGDGAPLPSLSAYEFDLRWQGTWTAKAFWTTD
ncbi:MAG TPA: hypothetical protein VF992_11985 [Thermoplasmata archaeon]